MEMTRTRPSRIQWVDVLRFLGIFAIYLGHFGKYTGKLHDFVFAYHVPLFFFAAGFFAQRKENESIWTFLWDKFLRLIVPYLIFALIFEIGYALRQDFDTLATLKDALEYLAAIRDTLSAPPLWFFSCLFFISVFYRLALMAVKNKVIILIAALVANILIRYSDPHWFWNIDGVLYYTFYYSLGHMVFPYLKKLDFSALQLRGKIIFICTAVLAVAVTALTYYRSKFFGISLFSQMGITLPDLLRNLYLVVIACTLIYANVLAAMLLKDVVPFQRIGRETLILCGTEWFTKNILLSSVFSILGLKLGLKTPFVTVVYTGVCVAVSFYLLAPLFHKYLPKIFGPPAKKSSATPATY